MRKKRLAPIYISFFSPKIKRLKYAHPWEIEENNYSKNEKRNGPNANPKIMGIEKTSKRKIKSDPKFLFVFFLFGFILIIFVAFDLFMKVKKVKKLLSPLLEWIKQNSKTKARS